MKLIKNKKGLMYDWLDIIVPFIVIFFIFIFMFTISSYNKKIVDNEINEMNDEFSGNQELINFLRIRIAEVVPDIDSFPEETREMTFAEFFIWYDYIKANEQTLDERNLNNLKKGLEAVFDPTYDEWNLQIRCFFTDTQYVDRYEYGKNPNSIKVYLLQLPSYSCYKLNAILYT